MSGMEGTDGFGKDVSQASEGERIEEGADVETDPHAQACSVLRHCFCWE